ncbi:lipase maturation factor 2 [Lissotriton helveticus]
MADTRLPRRMFLVALAGIYLCAFVSLYVQVPGLYGREGILPARKMLKYTGKTIMEEMKDTPTLLLLGPSLGLDTEQGMELICLLGVLLSMGAMLLEPLRDSLVFLLLWVLYLSLYQVGQVFLYFQWDSLLLETGFLAILIAPFHLLKWRTTQSRPHDNITFWLARWLLFRLMFASGVVKLTSRCPTWWGLTALTYHYETQCIPTPAAWYAHQFPVWFQKFSVVATYVIEIAIPLLFFVPVRRLRIFSFYSQVLLQFLIIITGNYNFFNLLTIVLCFSLLDDEHVGFWLGRSKKKTSSSWTSTLQSVLNALLELAGYCLLLYGSARYFGLKINWENQNIESKPAFTYHEFMQWLKAVMLPTVGIGALSLSWEILSAMYRCAFVRGFFWKLWTTLQMAVFSAAAVSMFGISLVPFTYMEFESNGKLWPGIHQMYNLVDRYQLTNSYGLFRRMTGVGGRPEVIVEGSYDNESWKEIEFMYKPGNISAPPPFVAPHQPRLDWQMWFAALGHQSQSPWFTSFVYRLLQGKKDVIDLLQVEEPRYPFWSRPPTYIRAQLYKYWFTEANEKGELPRQWWRRQHVEEFYPTVHLGDAKLEAMLVQHGLKDKGTLKRATDAPLPFALKTIQDYIHQYSAPAVLWSLLLTVATISLLRALMGRTSSSKPKSPKQPDIAVAQNLGDKNQQDRKKEEPAAETVEDKLEPKQRPAAGDGLKSVKRKKAEKS